MIFILFFFPDETIKFFRFVCVVIVLSYIVTCVYKVFIKIQTIIDEDNREQSSCISIGTGIE